MAKPKEGGVYPRGKVFWIFYMHRDEQVREPGGFDGKGAKTRTEAEEKLKQRLAEIAVHRYVGPEAERITVADLLDDYDKHLVTKGAKGTAQVTSGAKTVRAFFQGWRAVDVTTGALREFIAAEQKAGYAPGTINHKFQTLRAAFNLARKEERLLRVPYFPMLRADNARKGFFEREEHEAIGAHLPDPYRDLAEFGYRTGWRRGEIEPLEWRNVDREAGTVFLNDSKNGEPRTFPLRDSAGELNDVGELIERRWDLRAYQTKDGPAVSAFVFHVQGRRVWKFNRVWIKAAKEAGFPGRYFHDYRRTAVRDLIRAGVPQSVAMGITGHKTDSIFRRYNITDDRDKREALAKLGTYRSTRKAEGGTSRVSQFYHSAGRTSPAGSKSA